MRITYLKNDWISKLSKSEKTIREQAQPFKLSSKYLFYSEVQTGKFKRQHMKDIKELQKSMGQEIFDQSISCKFEINQKQNSFHKVPLASIKLSNNQQAIGVEKFKASTTVSQSTSTFTNMKVVKKFTKKTCPRNAQNLQNPTHEQVEIPTSKKFALSDSQIQFTDDSISLDCQSSLFSSEAESMEKYEENGKGEQGMTFLKDNCLLSESEDSFDPEQVFKKIKISEYLKKERQLDIE